MSRSLTCSIALTLTLCALAAVVTGARLTSANSLPAIDPGPWKMLHRGLSSATALGALALAFSLSGPIRSWLLASVLLAALPGGMLEAKAAANLAGLAHAVAASVLTSVLAVVTLQLSPSWQGQPSATFLDEGRPSLAALARATWIALLIQTALGALYRHQILGLLPHVAGAMLVMGMAMYAGIAAFSTENAVAAVKRPALFLLIMTGVQMLIGLGAYLYRVQFKEQATGLAAMLIFSMIHVAVGALTTACSALMGMQITRYVRPAVVAQ
jgi:hypothetical protein